jgi:hypothetical protein
MTLYSFRQFNPDWEVILYLSDNNNDTKTWIGVEEQDFNKYKGISYLDKIKELNIEIKKVEFTDEIKDIFINASPVHESDLFRCYELYKNGGFYCDMDVIFFRSMDDFYDDIVKNNYDTIVYQCNFHMAIGFLGASKDNIFYKDLFEYGLANFRTDNYQSLGVDLIYKMFGGDRYDANVISRIIKRYPQLNIFSIPTNLVYYFDWTKIEYNFNNPIYVNKFPVDSIGYHWFGGSPTSQYYNNIMTEENYKEYKNTFAVIAKKILE